MVTNGTAFDRATIDMGQCRRIVVPSKTEVESSEEPGRLTLMMKKEMGFMGHPPERTTVDEERRQMGCAYRKHDGKIFVGKFGEFDSETRVESSSRSRFVFPREPSLSEMTTWNFRVAVAPGVLLSVFIKRTRTFGARWRIPANIGHLSWANPTKRHSRGNEHLQSRSRRPASPTTRPPVGRGKIAHGTVAISTGKPG
jgi:hypothetical protein